MSPFLTVIEGLNREIRRRTRVVDGFLDGNPALMLVCARLRHVSGTQWGNKKCLEATAEGASIVGRLHSRQRLQTHWHKILDATELAVYLNYYNNRVSVKTVGDLSGKSASAKLILHVALPDQRLR